MKAKDLKKALEQVHPETEIFIDVLPAFDLPASATGEYEWHQFDANFRLDIGEYTDENPSFAIIKVFHEIAGY